MLTMTHSKKKSTVYGSKNPLATVSFSHICNIAYVLRVWTEELL